MLSSVFIRRPRLAMVIAIVTTLAGLMAIAIIPVAQYPDIVPPQVSVTAVYPGAGAAVVESTVAQPIEAQVNGVSNMLYMKSTSGNDGSYTLTVSFALGTDPDINTVNVQNRVSLAESKLPEEVRRQGLSVKKKSAALLQVVNLYSPKNTYDSLYVSNYATINIRDELSRLPGVGNVTVFGAGQYSMRVWLDPNKLQARGLMPQDVIQAIQQQSQQVTAGQVGAPPAPQGQAFQYTLNVNGRLDDASQFENIIVKTGNVGDVIRVRDLGSVELGAQTYSQVFSLNQKPATGIGVFLSPGANALQVEKEVQKKVAQLAKQFPQDIKYDTPFDTTKFVQASIDEVYRTLIEAGLLVLVVILVFLQDWRAMLVPATTVPVTIIGAFAAMAALGFTINLSTLFAIVLAIGIVVDDAIVVVEGAAHNIEQGMSGHDAAIKAMDELFAPIVGITLVLISVFLPAAFLPGLTGRMYAQFALVIAATALLSAVNAATLKPTQCALWLRPPVPPEQRNFFYRGFNAVYDRVERGYTRIIGGIAAHAKTSVLVALVLIGIAGYGLSRVPTGFIPIEDQGYLLAAVQLPDGAAIDRTQQVLDRVTEIARKTPGVEQVVSIAGISALDNSSSLANAGVAYVILKDWGSRGPGEDLRSLVYGLNDRLAVIPEARILVIPPPPIQGIGNAAGFAMQVQLRDGNADYGKLQAVTGAVVSNAQTQSALQRVQSSFRSMVPQFDVQVDRVKTETLHVTTDQIFSTLSSYLGASYVNQFTKFGRTFQVYTQADAQYRLTLRDIQNMMVRNSNGDMVPLGTVANITPSVGPSLISLYNLYPSATIIGLPSQGYSSGQSMSLMEEIAAKTLPPGTGYEWTAMSYQEKEVGSQIYFVFALALLLVYLVLAGQYESWYAPISVILAVPLSLLGPMLVLTALRIENNLYTQIGTILLIALSAKNAILIVEVALEHHIRDGKPVLESAIDAARARFRPILMTSFAFILGVLPLVIATGAGANARKSIGITVFSGMIASTCLAVLFVPAFFVVVQNFENWRKAKKGKAAGPQAAQQAPGTAH